MNILGQLLAYTLISIATSSDSIHFSTEKSWQQIKTEAKVEGKFIFVDCYATWCGPCKMMDKQVYTNDSVGAFMNDHFVSVKVQMDTSQSDNQYTKDWYQIAHELQSSYKVNSLPTYLFFSPNGEIVHKEIGAKVPKDFLQTASSALDPDKQYYNLLRKFEKDDLPYSRITYLAKTAKTLGDVDMAIKIADRYIHKYLVTMSADSFCTKENLSFVSAFYQVINSKDRIFKFYLQNPKKVDSLVGNKGYSRRLTDYVITKEEILPGIETAKSNNQPPKWELMYKNVKDKYSVESARRNILNAKPGYYKSVKDWKNYTKYLIQQVQEYGMQNLHQGMLGAFYLNNNAWYVFEHSNNKKELETVLQWCDKSIQMDSEDLVFNDMDTKANILYKLGRTKEAISLEEEVIKRNEEQAIKKKREPVALYRQTLIKMKEGKKTWDD